MHRKLTGTEAIVKPAPPREMLQKFGGPLSVEEFRAAPNNNQQFTVRHSPQLVPLGMVGEDMNFDNKGGVLQLLKKNGRGKGSKTSSGHTEGKGTSFGNLFKVT